MIEPSYLATWAATPVQFKQMALCGKNGLRPLQRHYAVRTCVIVCLGFSKATYGIQLVCEALFGGGAFMIHVEKLTRTYPGGKGIFDLDFEVMQGTTTGYLGPNGAGKTTTIRVLLGFMYPQQGCCTIGGLDCRRDAPKIQRMLGYVPGEISFLDGMNGDEFLRFMCRMRGTTDLTMQKMLLDRFELDPKGKIKRFSKGMKQKLGIVAAWMHNPDVLVLDEPTSGLDPLMQERFVEWILEEKIRGKTILMSSHIFEEVERTCDTVVMIKNGRIIQTADVAMLKSAQTKVFLLRTDNTESAAACFVEKGFDASLTESGQLAVQVHGDQMDPFIKAAAQLTILDMEGKQQTLEDIFMQFYRKTPTEQNESLSKGGMTQ
jgi:ABC-2 type transport system ATP-binding protein